MIRLGIAAAVFLIMALWEWATPCRPQRYGRERRWPANLSLAVLNALTVRWLMPLSLVGAAEMAEAHGFGLAYALPVPALVHAIVTFVALDLVVYAQHVAFHRIGALWRFHRVHHADLEFDVTTGLRFHPGEAMISWGFKVAAVFALGAPPLVVLVFEAALNASSMFNHGNVRIPRPVDALLRLLIVTPDMHRVHHSRLDKEMNSNFGFNLPWWDRLFSTYRADPALGHGRMELGLDQFRTSTDLGLMQLLLQPWWTPSPSAKD